MLQFQRWNHDQSARIEIHVQQDVDVELCNSIDDYGYQVVPTSQRLADMFDLSVVSQEDLVRAKNLALSHGDVVLWIGVDHNQNVLINASSLAYEDKGFDMGLLIYPKAVWEADEYGTEPYTYQSVEFFFNGWIKDQIAKNLAGELFEAHIYEDVTSDACCIRGGFYSPEDALKEAQSEFPDILWPASHFDNNDQP